MVLTERNIYPQLELNPESEYHFSIQLFYDEIKHFSLYWLAVEELELRYPNNRINKDLVYKSGDNTIKVIDARSRSSVAQIRYSPVN